MPLSPDDPTLIRRYLLGEVDEATIAQIEKRVVDDEVFFDAIELAEDDLLEKYLRGTGTPHERQALERFVSTPERQRQLVLTRELARRFGTPADTESRFEPTVMGSGVARSTVGIGPPGWAGGWMGLAAAASVLISAAGVVYLGVQTRGIQGDVAVMIAREREEVQRIVTAASRPLPITQSFLVSPERTLRSSGAADFVLAIVDPSGRVAIQFQLASHASPPPYGVVVRRVGRQRVQVWGETGLSAEAGRVVAIIPSSVLFPDDYQATVSTAEGELVADYRFRVTS